MKLKWARPPVPLTEPAHHDAAQHAAVVELMVLTVFCDTTLTLSELDAVDRFDAEHRDWVEGAFSVHEYVGPATAKVRRAGSRPGGRDELLKDAASRITEPGLRTATVGYCEHLIAGHGPSAAERRFLDQLGRALANDGRP